MNIKDQLLYTHSKANTILISNYIDNHPGRFAELMDAFLAGDYRLSQRSAWVVSGLGIKYPELIKPYRDDLISAIDNPIHPAIQRNVLKLMSESNIPLTEDQEGKLLNQSFDLLANPLTAVAIRVHAMQFIANLCKTYPDLGIELKTLIEDGMEHGSAGFKSRGRRILKELAKTT